MTVSKWQGVYPAMLTPFSEDDTIDFIMFEKNMAAQLAAGVDGLILGGSLGEASTLDTIEKLDLLKFAIAYVNGRVPVVMNIAEQATRKAVQLANKAELLGASGLMLLPPMRYKADDHETVEYFVTVAKSTSLPVMIYNNPVDYKIEVTIPMFEKLAALSNINAVKESTRDVTNITRMRNHFGDRFDLLCGVDTLVMEELMLGADGIVGGLVDAFPKEMVTLFQLIKSGNYQDALLIYRWFLPLLELDIHAKLVQYIKLAATATGICNENVRAPRLMVTGEERQKVLDVINKAIATNPVSPIFMKSLVS
jgi:4-hydroxy-tetrahydrodipicolinate synthase